ncbi:hypothetical protein PIB30_076136 [Stylosanthes scabra]|uniref:Uncharacterized protein n=1 Tax=Stylosanthes scabra TaxID=79078 RepID=A0ABU6RQX9_9FABA|nr:hypothetical protein [Stylosanthes scabra]
MYYEIEKREKYEDSDERADSDMAIVNTRRYHSDDEPFIHLLHSVRFNPDRPYELPIEQLWALFRRVSRRSSPAFESVAAGGARYHSHPCERLRALFFCNLTATV